MNPVLVDSSFFIALLGRRMDPLALLAESEHLFDFAITPEVWVEVVRGRVEAKTRDRFGAAFQEMLNLRGDPARAARLGWDLERGGERIPVPDILIAAAALEHAAPLLTFDRHFERIPGLALLASIPV